MSAEPFINIKYAVIEQAAAGTNTIVSAVASKKIRVISWVLSLSVAGTAKFLNTGGAAVTGVMLVGTTPATCAGSVYGPLFETTPGVGLDITSVTGSAHGHLTYQEIAV